MTCRDEEDYNRTFDFLEKEAKCDLHNYEELLKIEPSHLTKTKLTAMLKLKEQWKKANDYIVKQYKEGYNSKEDYEKYQLRRRKRTWFII